ncbi:MAG: hypothetical protein EAZ08_07370 [Cytophagales bacterium]|nr:MAG: hypothetical protein EAZ08_07370 [Cytophagales bacterium]
MKKQIKLEELNKNNDFFDAPKGYFEGLPQQIQKRIQQPKKQAVWQFGFSPKYALAIASFAILLIVGGKFLFSTQNSEQQILSEISEQQIRQYLLQDDVQEHDLMDLYLETTKGQEKSEEAIITDEILETEIDIDDIEELL